MGFYSKLKGWQKGLVLGFGFTFILSLSYATILVIMDFILESKGLPHMCFVFSEVAECTIEQAISTRFMFFLTMTGVFGIPVSIFSAIIGHLVEKVGIGK